MLSRLSKAGANERGWGFTVQHLRDSVRGSEVAHKLMCERWRVKWGQ